MNNFRKLALCFLLSVATILNIAGSKCASASALAHNGVKILHGTEAGGIFEICLSANALRILSRSNGYILAAQGPLWQVKVWRDDRKQCGQISLAQFLKSDLVSSNRISYLAELGRPNKVEKATQGLDKLLIYHFPNIKTINGSGIFISDREDGNGLTGGQDLKPQLLALDNNYPQQATDIISKIYNSPKVKGFPICSFVTLPNKKQDSLLNGRILKRNFDIPEASLSAPKGYKQVVLDKKMFFTTGQSDLLDEMTSK